MKMPCWNGSATFLSWYFSSELLVKKKKGRQGNKQNYENKVTPGCYFPPKCCFCGSLGLVRLVFTRRVDIVNDKKVLLCALISLFFCCCPPHPSPTRQNPTLMTHGSRAELTDTSSLIIRLLESSGPSRPSLQGTQMSRSYCWNVDWDRWRGTHRGEKALWRHPCPRCCTVSFKSVCWQTSDNNSGSCAMFCLAAVIIFIERTSLLIKLCLLSGAVLLAFLFGLPVRGENSVSLLTRERYIIVRMISLFLKKIMFVLEEAIIGTKRKWKQKNTKSMFQFWNDDFWHFWGPSFTPLFFHFDWQEMKHMDRNVLHVFCSSHAPEIVCKRNLNRRMIFLAEFKTTTTSLCFISFSL